jgi:hypothetical protein
MKIHKCHLYGLYQIGSLDVKENMAIHSSILDSECLTLVEN